MYKSFSLYLIIIIILILLLNFPIINANSDLKVNNLKSIIDLHPESRIDLIVNFSIFWNIDFNYLKIPYEIYNIIESETGALIKKKRNHLFKWNSNNESIIYLFTILEADTNSLNIVLFGNEHLYAYKLFVFSYCSFIEYLADFIDFFTIKATMFNYIICIENPIIKQSKSVLIYKLLSVFGYGNMPFKSQLYIIEIFKNNETFSINNLKIFENLIYKNHFCSECTVMNSFWKTANL